MVKQLRNLGAKRSRLHETHDIACLTEVHPSCVTDWRRAGLDPLVVVGIVANTPYLRDNLQRRGDEDQSRLAAAAKERELLEERQRAGEVDVVMELAARSGPGWEAVVRAIIQRLDGSSDDKRFGLDQ